MSQKEPSDVKALGTVQQLLDFLALQMFRSEGFSCSEGGAERTVVAGEDDGAGTGFDFGMVLVERGDFGFVVGCEISEGERQGGVKSMSLSRTCPLPRSLPNHLDRQLRCTRHDPFQERTVHQKLLSG